MKTRPEIREKHYKNLMVLVTRGNTAQDMALYAASAMVDRDLVIQTLERHLKEAQEDKEVLQQENKELRQEVESLYHQRRRTLNAPL
jgi:hypothetical protein